MKEHNRNIRLLLILGALLFVSGCAEALAALDTAARGASWLSSAIAMADAGQDAYFARHPSPENEPKVQKALLSAKQGDAALKALLAAGEAAASKDVEEAKKNALEAYGELYKLLTELGVLEGRAPPGGAETDAPVPEPFVIPTPDDIQQRL